MTPGNCVMESNNCPCSLLIKIDDDKKFTDEVRKYLQIKSHLESNNTSPAPNIKQIYDDYGVQNQKRRQDLLKMLETKLLCGKYYVSGNEIAVKGANPQDMLQNALENVVEANYHKLQYIEVLSMNAKDELRGLLSEDRGLNVGLDDKNPRAAKTVLDWLMAKNQINQQIILKELVDHFAGCPFGWPDDETNLVLVRKYLSGDITFISSSKDMNKSEKGFEYVYTTNNNSSSTEVDNPGEELMPLNPSDISIISQINKVVTEHNFKYLHDSVLSRSLFSIESNFVEENPDKIREASEDDLFFDPATEIKLFTNDKAGKSGRAKWYIANRDVITSGIAYLDTWKVVVSSANAGGQKRSNQIAILDNFSAFGRSRVALKTFATKTEANNFFNYAQSELIRFAFLMTDENLSSLAKQVPDILNYRDDNGIIDFHGDVNQQLYDLFEIDAANIAHIREVLASKPK